MPFGYAPASADADKQCSPSLMPLHPPKDTITSPPAPRIALIFDWSSPPVSGRAPSHCGLQLPLESMNARVKNLIPVADITAVGLCGTPQPKYSYGATAMLDPPPPPLVVAVTAFDAPETLPAASCALTVNV